MDYRLYPTDPDLRLYVVSPPNQGRFALVARPGTADLIATPELTAQDNRVVETREFQLAELGRAKVIETSQTYGTPDSDYRAMFGEQDDKGLRGNLKNYVDYTYGEAKVAGISHSERADLTRPFELKIELEDAQRATSARTEAAVGIFVSQLAQRLPPFFQHEPKKDKDKDDKPTPPRTQDFFISECFTYDWHYIINAPAGFRIRQLPEAKDEKLGPATLTSHFQAVGDTKLLADFRFVMPKRRFTAAEGLALRDAVVEMGKRRAVLIYFDQIGETDLASGRVKEALAEFAALRKLHPQEALHALQTARALLAAGAGEAARAEARRAVAMEPASAKAYVQLAEILKNDLVGRSMQKGFDGEGAVSAYRKALALDPDDDETRANLAILLEYNKAGERYGTGAKLEEAVAEYKKIAPNLAGLGLPQNYPVALLRSGHFQELQDYLANQPTSENNQVLLVCAAATLNGSKAALQRAREASGVEAQRRVMLSAGQTLLSMRQYGPAADIFEAAAAGAPNPADIASLIQVLRKTKRMEDKPTAIKQPEDALRVLFARAIKLDEHEKDWMETISPLMMEAQGSGQTDSFRRGVAAGMGSMRRSGLAPEVGLDLTQAVLQFSREGSDETGWVIHMAVPGNIAPGVQNQVWFVIKDKDTYRLVGGVGSFEGVALLVLQLVDQGQNEQAQNERAKIWLDRVRQELSAGSGDDPLGGPLFARLWHEDQAADPQAMRVAAAVLLISAVKRHRQPHRRGDS